MTVTMTPIADSDAIDGSYHTVASGRALAAKLPGMSTLLAKTDDELGVLLFAASLDIDSAMPYQGVKYASDQVREFPRYQQVAGAFKVSWNCNTGSTVGVWDWDDDTNTAVVPQLVLIACLHQAAALCDPQFKARLDAIRSGLSAQSTGSMSESYLKPADLPGGLNGLCDLAHRLMDKYRLRSAPLL